MPIENPATEGVPSLPGEAGGYFALQEVVDQLRASNGKLRGLFELSPLGIALTDMLGHYVEFNEAFRRICGYPEEELKQLDYWALTPQEYAEQEARQLESLELCGFYGPYEKEYIRKDGSRVPLQLSGMLINGSDGQRYIWSIVEDISARKRAEQIQQEDQAKLTGLINSAMDAIVSTDEQQNIILFNPAAEIMFGMAASDVLGQSLDILIPPHFRDNHRRHVEEFGRTGITSRSLAVPGIAYGLRAGGEVFQMEASISQVEIGGRKLFTAILRDISQRKKLETKIRETKEVLQSVLETVPVRIFWKDAELRYLGCNAAFATDAGLTSAQQIIGKDDYQLAWKEQADLYRADDRKVIESGIPKLRFEEPVTTVDGQPRWARTSKVPMLDAEGNVSGVLGVYDDFTESKLNNESLARSTRLIEAISRAQNRMIMGSEHRETFNDLLEILIDFSGSQFGLIGEVKHDDASALYMSSLAISNIAWNEETREIFAKSQQTGVEFHNLNSLFGTVITTGQMVVANDAAHDPRAGGLPAGHPEINTFLGVPLFKGTELIGLLGVANRAGGYDPLLCRELAPLAVTCASLIESWRGAVRRLQAEQALLQSERRLQQAVSISGIGLFDHDLISSTLYCSPQLRVIYGFGTDEPVSMETLGECIFPADRDRVFSAIKNTKGPEGKGHLALSYRIVRRDGAIRWLAVQFRSSFVGEGATRHAVNKVGAIRDITQRKQNEETVQLAASIYKVSHEGIVISDASNRIVDVNPAFTRITGYTLDEVRGQNPRLFQSGKHPKHFYEEMWKSILLNDFWQGEVFDLRKDGTQHVKWLSISVIRDQDGEIYRYVGQFSDITEKKRQDDLIWTQANYDALTGLPNRRLLTDRIQQAMSSGGRSGRYGAVLSLDLDQFKQLNDTLGHSMGDRLLVEAARRIQACLREEDTVARMGGDEFLVVLNELSNLRSEAAIHAEQVAEKLRSELCMPYQLGDNEYHSSSSIGVVLFHGHRETQEDLLAHVDAAMYQAKSKGRNTTCFFDSAMQSELEQRSQLEHALRNALQRDELELHYQLQIDSSGKPIGVEALLRWKHPKLGMVSPAQFIPVAEDTGLILPIGLWVLETACRQLARWQADPALRHLSISVNVSAVQFREPKFVALVEQALQICGICPGVLKLELTESLVLHNVDDSIRKMNELKDAGILFSMDDFGTGYSSLSYLSRLPIDQIKIDQSFVRNITTDKSDAAIVQTIISMAHGLGLEVIAEGVETLEQRDFLEVRGCHAYQGYLYAKPLPIGEVEKYLMPC